MNWNDIFYYSAGILYWKISPNKGIPAGSVAGNPARNQYLQVQYKNKVYKVHRIIWEMHYRQIPIEMQIDHIDHDRKNNRIENLRLVSCDVNLKNQSKRKTNKSGVTGVYDRNTHWESSIRVNNKLIYLGRFKTFEEAKDARKKAELLYGFHPNHGK